ncbi:MAG: prolipoprotein diacylglyceryl transferase family protein, partial [Candidatus Promineifilaceae bacterium]
MLPAVNLGSLAIPTRGLVVIMGIWLLLSALERAGRALRLDAGRLYSVGVLAILAGFLAGRLAFVGLHWSAYQDNLLAVAWPLTGGFNLWGGLAGALLAAAFG